MEAVAKAYINLTINVTPTAKKALKAHKINREKGRETGRERKQKGVTLPRCPFSNRRNMVPHEHSPLQALTSAVTMKKIMKMMVFCRSCALPQVQ